jgi:hypothetical protein
MSQNLARLYAALGLTPELVGEEDLEHATAMLQARMRVLAEEVLEAEAAGRTLASAVTDEEAFPALHQLHVAARDLLTMSLPAPLARWVREALESPESPVSEELQRGLAALAAAPEAPPASRALARLLLFEAVRVSLLVAEHLSGTSIEAVGAGQRDVDEIAEQEVGAWIASLSELAGEDPEVRPLEILVSAALLRLNHRVDELRVELTRVGEELVDALRLRASFDVKLRDMEAADAILARNAFAVAIDEERREIEDLQKEHAFVLGDRRRAALDQQVSRLRRRMARGEWPRRRSPAFVDLVADAPDVPAKDPEGDGR